MSEKHVLTYNLNGGTFLSDRDFVAIAALFDSAPSGEVEIILTGINKPTNDWKDFVAAGVEVKPIYISGAIRPGMQFNDALTPLPNRIPLYERLRHFIRSLFRFRGTA